MFFFLFFFWLVLGQLSKRMSPCEAPARTRGSLCVFFLFQKLKAGWGEIKEAVKIPDFFNERLIINGDDVQASALSLIVNL